MDILSRSSFEHCDPTTSLADQMPLLAGHWEKIQDRLRSDIGETTFAAWIKPISLQGVEDGVLKMTVPTRFIRDWLRTNYETRLNALWQKENPEVKSVRFMVKTQRARYANQATSLAAESDDAAGSTPATPATEKAPMAVPSTRIDPRNTFETFVVGKPNEFAYAAARRVAEGAETSFNPLFLYSSSGLGKTHLMHAIACHIRQTDPTRSVVYLSAEQFINCFVEALKEKTTVDFKRQFRSVDVLMIDDVHFISGKNSTQEEFFHTFNALVDLGRQIVISADKSPSDLEGIQDRLKSRLNCGLVVDIHPTSYELRLGILRSKAALGGCALPDRVMEFLAHRITGNVRELVGALNRLSAHQSLIGREITLEVAQEVLHDVLRASDRRVSIDEIQKRVAEYYKVRMTDMTSARRARSVARPRQIAMYLSKQLTTRSLPEIGRKFGNRDHTTVMHAVRKIKELRDTDAGFAEDVDLLRRLLES